MIPIWQKRITDCAVVCFAMIMEIGYWKSFFLLHKWWQFFNPLATFNTPIPTIIKAAGKLGKKLECVLIGPYFNIEQLEKNAIVIVSFDAGITSHAVVWNATKRAFHDPLLYNQLTDEQIRSGMVYILFINEEIN